MAKFKKYDMIETIEQGRGFEKATVLNTYIAQKGRFKGQEMYYLRIVNGTATMPVSAEVNYRLFKKKQL